MDMHYEASYDVEPARVFAMFTDEEFLRAKVAALSDGPGEVVECTHEGDTWRLVTTRTVAMDVPGFAKKFLQPKNTIKQTDVWRQEAGGWEGSWKVEPRGVPVSLTGTMRLEARDTGCVEVIDGKIKASVPLVGGKLEKLVLDGVDENLDHEVTFGQEWLAAH